MGKISSKEKQKLSKSDKKLYKRCQERVDVVEFANCALK